MSTRDPIEDLFRDNQHGLDEKPRDLIWDRIEERLDEKPVLKNKTKVWKYAVAASVFAGISLAGLYFLNPNENPSKMESIVLMEPVEMNKEKATEILDQIEAESTAIVTTKSQAPAPEIMEEELKKTVIVSTQNSTEPATEISAYDAPVMAAPAPQMEIESVKSMAKEKQDEVSSFASKGYLKKEQNKEVGQLDLEGRRLGNSMEKTVLNEFMIADSTIVSQFYVFTSYSELKYQLISKNKDFLIYENSTIEFPKQIVFNLKNNETKVEFKGNENEKNSAQSKEIQQYVNENKSWLFNTIQID